jgi:DNA-binding transcriptional MerR regulator
MIFGKKAAVALTHVTYKQLDHWATTGVVKPSIRGATGKGSRREYSFKDLISLKVAKRLRDEGISLQKIRKALAYLKRNYPGKGTPLAEFRFLTDGATLFVVDKDPQKILDTLRNGQLVISLALGEIIEGLRGELQKIVVPKEEKVEVGDRIFTMILTPNLESGGFLARCQDPFEAVSQGETEQEALDNLIEALEKHLEYLQEPQIEKTKAE